MERTKELWEKELYNFYFRKEKDSSYVCGDVILPFYDEKQMRRFEYPPRYEEYKRDKQNGKVDADTIRKRDDEYAERNVLKRQVTLDNGGQQTVIVKPPSRHMTFVELRIKQIKDGVIYTNSSRHPELYPINMDRFYLQRPKYKDQWENLLDL